MTQLQIFGQALKSRRRLSPFNQHYRTMPYHSKTNPLKVILIAGLVAGTLDITAASIQFYINTGHGPEPVFRYIASAAFGKGKTGWEMVAWGILFHYLIATLFAAFFVFLYWQWKWLSKNIIVAGLLYGLFAWVIMNRVVVPLSRIPDIPFNWKKAIIAALILMFMIGLPIALITKKYYPSPKPAA